MSFSHLHLHSAASDGTASQYELVERAHALGFSALALTDHNTLDGHLAFVSACSEFGIQPILGVELRVYVEGRHGHAVVLSRTRNEYERLRQLVRRHRKVQLNDLRGVGYVTTACIGGVPGQQLVKGDYFGAQDTLETMRRVLGDDLLVEVQPSFGTVLPWMLSLAKQLRIPAMVTNDVHHSTGSGHMCLCSEQQMAERCQLPGYRQAMEYTGIVASQCVHPGAYPEVLVPRVA